MPKLNLQAIKKAVKAAEVIVDSDGEPSELSRSDFASLVEGASIASLMAVTVAQYNRVRISAAHPAMARDESWAKEEDRFGVEYEKDLGWLWGALELVTQHFTRTGDQEWSELNAHEKDVAEALTFLHNWVKLAGIQRWSSFELEKQLLAAERQATLRELLQELPADSDARGIIESKLNHG